MREIKRRRRRRRSRRDRQTEESREVSESLPHTEAVTPQHARYRHRCVHKPFVTELLFAHLGHFLSCSTPRTPLQCVSCISLQYSLSHLPPLHLFCPPEYPPARSFAQIPVAGSIIQPRPVRVWSSARVANPFLALPATTSWLSFYLAFFGFSALDRGSFYISLILCAHSALACRVCDSAIVQLFLLPIILSYRWLPAPHRLRRPTRTPRCLVRI